MVSVNVIVVVIMFNIVIKRKVSHTYQVGLYMWNLSLHYYPYMANKSQECFVLSVYIVFLEMK